MQCNKGLPAPRGQGRQGRSRYSPPLTLSWVMSKHGIMHKVQPQNPMVWACAVCACFQSWERGRTAPEQPSCSTPAAPPPPRPCLQGSQEKSPPGHPRRSPATRGQQRRGSGVVSGDGCHLGLATLRKTGSPWTDPSPLARTPSAPQTQLKLRAFRHRGPTHGAQVSPGISA